MEPEISPISKVTSDPKLIFIKYPINDAKIEHTVPGAIGELPVGHTFTIKFIIIFFKIVSTSI